MALSAEDREEILLLIRQQIREIARPPVWEMFRLVYGLMRALEERQRAQPQPETGLWRLWIEGSSNARLLYEPAVGTALGRWFNGYVFPEK